MVKIKVKKDMFLAELIEWGYKNIVTGETFINSSDDEVTFLDDGWIETSTAIHPRSIFEVEVEEEITEQTKIPTLIELIVSNLGQFMCMHFNTSIKNTIGDDEEDAKAMSKAFYMLNDDYTMTLLWRNGGMVK